MGVTRGAHDGCTRAHRPATGARAPIGVALHAVPCGRSNDSRSGPRSPMRRFSVCWADPLSSDWRTRPPSRARGGSPVSADTPAAGPLAPASRKFVHRHTGKKCCSEQGFREFRQHASPLRPTRPRDQCPVSRRTWRCPPSPGTPSHPGRAEGSRPAHGSRKAPRRRRFQRGLPQCERRPQRRGWPHPSDALSVHPPRAGRPGADMERRARGCAPPASWPAWPRPSDSSPRAWPAPP